METKKLNTFLNACIFVIFAVVILYYYQSNSMEKDKLIEDEEIICLVAICINEKGVGDQCFEFEASLSLVSLTKDSSALGGKRLIIEPSFKECAANSE